MKTLEIIFFVSFSFLPDLSKRNDETTDIIFFVSFSFLPERTDEIRQFPKRLLFEKQDLTKDPKVLF
jgi:hypothetical protein